MKKFLFLLFMAIAFVLLPMSCDDGGTTIPGDPAIEDPADDPGDDPADDPATKTVIVKNSKWETTKTVDVLASTRGTEIPTEEELLAEIIEYNMETTDDQLTLLDEEVPIEESPVIDVYSVDPVTHEIISQYLDWPRQDYVDRYSVFVLQTQSEGGVLYVDQIPPAPIIPDDPRTDYEKYALYYVEADGAILAEKHCADFDWAAGGYESLEQYFTMTRYSWELQARSDGGGRYVVAGRIYTAP